MSLNLRGYVENILSLTSFCNYPADLSHMQFAAAHGTLVLETQDLR
jgi:hypothetical protein